MLLQKVYPENRRVELQVPVDASVKSHEDYKNQVGVAMGLYTMLTTDQGCCYGEELGKYQTRYAEWIRAQARDGRKDQHSPQRQTSRTGGRSNYSKRQKYLPFPITDYKGHKNRSLDESRPQAAPGFYRRD